jgi:hypothetical protein
LLDAFSAQAPARAGDPLAARNRGHQIGHAAMVRAARGSRYGNGLR